MAAPSLRVGPTLWFWKDDQFFVEGRTSMSSTSMYFPFLHIVLHHPHAFPLLFVVLHIVLRVGIVFFTLKVNQPKAFVSSSLFPTPLF